MASIHQIFAGMNEPPITVAGIDLARPAADKDGKYRFHGKLGVVTISREDVAAAAEYVMGAVRMGLLQGTSLEARCAQQLKRFVAQHDPKALRRLLGES